MPPKLSIVTPIFNSADFLGELLDSVEALRIDHEHLVFDGGSQDGTLDLLRARENASLDWVSEPDRGQMHAVNKGLARVRGEYVNWINGDNAYLPGLIERAVAFLDEHPEVAAVFGGIDMIDEHGCHRRRYIPPLYSWQRYLFFGDYIPTETIVFRRALLTDTPALDERFVDGADYDFYLRLLHRRRVHRIPEPMIRYRFHPDSKTYRDPFLQQREHMVIRRQWSRGPRDDAIMLGFDRLKRFLLPRISAWPRPYPDA